MPHKFKPKPQGWLVKLANNLSTAGGGGVFGCWGGGDGVGSSAFIEVHLVSFCLAVFAAPPF